MIEKGKLLFQVYVFDGKPELETYIITQIRRNRRPKGSGKWDALERKLKIKPAPLARWVTAVKKIPFVTWGKLSKRHGDFGIFPKVDPLYVTRWRECDPIPSQFKTTERAAWVAFKQGLKNLTTFEHEWEGATEISESERKRLLGLAKRNINRLSKKR